MRMGVPDKTTTARVMRAVADRLNLDPEELKKGSSENSRTLARRIALLCLQQLFPLASNMTLGQIFGYDDHTWVGYHKRAINDLASTEPETWKKIESIVRAIVAEETARMEAEDA